MTTELEEKALAAFALVAGIVIGRHETEIRRTLPVDSGALSLEIAEAVEIVTRYMGKWDAANRGNASYPIPEPDEADAIERILLRARATL